MRTVQRGKATDFLHLSSPSSPLPPVSRLPPLSSSSLSFVFFVGWRFETGRTADEGDLTRGSTDPERSAHLNICPSDRYHICV